MSWTSTVVRFSRVMATVDDERAVLGALLAWAVRHAGADAGIVLEALPHGAVRIAGSRGIAIAPSDSDDDALRIVRAISRDFPRDRTLLLASPGQILGTLVLLYRGDVEAERLRMAATLAGIASACLAQLRRHAATDREHDGMVHDLRNTLAPLPLLVHAASAALDAGSRAQASVELTKTLNVVRHAFATIDRVRDADRGRHDAPAVVDVDAAVRDAVEMARARIAARGEHAKPIVLDVVLGGPSLVVAHPSDFVAALVNLLANAIDALGAGGTIRVATFPSGRRAVVVVSDDGPGMPSAVERRAFEPYFTTKGEKGTGLGLAMVHEFARKAGATITLRTAPSAGTTFTLSLPAARTAAASPVRRRTSRVRVRPARRVA